MAITRAKSVSTVDSLRQPNRVPPLLGCCGIMVLCVDTGPMDADIMETMEERGELLNRYH